MEQKNTDAEFERKSKNGSDGAERASDGSADLSDQVRAADQKVRQFVYEKPLVALGGAMVVGYAVGRLMQQR